mgnify:CR=1 FL=1
MIVALFPDEASLRAALSHLAEAGIGPVETYTPAPLAGAPAGSPIPLLMLGAGVLGALASLGLQAWSSAAAYPLLIGGRPLLAWPAFIPTAFENGVLLAILAGFLGFLAANRLPLLHHPVDRAAAARRASQDGWVLALAADHAAERRAAAVLRPLHPLRVEALP